ncbi:MAG: hypothetical protein JWO82_3768 [Akkermansiaceae bacterium]|nr:hypothetical protein [Akkermansiaceae bacterium]
MSASKTPECGHYACGNGPCEIKSYTPIYEELWDTWSNHVYGDPYCTREASEAFDAMSSALRKVEASRNDLLEIVKRLLEIAPNVSVESGCCHCGETLNPHSVFSDHGFVDQGRHLFDELIRDAAAIARATKGGGEPKPSADQPEDEA